MPEALMRPQSAPLRLIALRLAVPDLAVVARQPDVIETFRLTVQYHDGRNPDQLATLTRRRGQEAGKLAVVYRRPDDKPLALEFTIEAERLNQFSAALRRVSFDRLDDMPDIPWFGADLWLIERAAGSFHHDVILSPDRAAGVHAEIAASARQTLREAVRAIQV